MSARGWKGLLFNLLAALFLPLLFGAALLPRRRTKLLVWGSTPIISNKYYAAAMREAGHETMTVMGTVYGINREQDFDRLFRDFAPRFIPGPLRFAVGALLALLFVLRRAAVLHTSYWGFALSLTAFWRLESVLLRLAGVKTVVLSFGGDGYVYSRVIDTSLRHGLLASYPRLARVERRTRKMVEHWNAHADAVLVGLMVDGLGRWDVTMNQIFIVDTRAWTAKTDYSQNDGLNGPVRILHAPNHRGFKGTEFLVDAVARLKAEGLQAELVLLERVPNEQVKEVMRSVDMLAEQFIATGYAINGIEGLASGLPVLANLEHEAYTRVFRRYGFLDECPVLSTTPETLVDNLRLLIRNPGLRERLGRAGRAYAEKYHGYEMAQYLFGALYDKLLHGKDVDLIALFHPLKSEFNRRRPRVEHPLVENRLPAGWSGADAQEAR